MGGFQCVVRNAVEFRAKIKPFFFALFNYFGELASAKELIPSIVPQCNLVMAALIHACKGGQGGLITMFLYNLPACRIAVI